MKKFCLLLLILFSLASCVIYDLLLGYGVYDKGYIPPIGFPALYLTNSSDDTISVETYYYDKHSNQDMLWEKQDILPGETKLVMDWVYPTRLCVYIDDCIVTDYKGSNDGLLYYYVDSADWLDAHMQLVSARCNGDNTKYTYENIPFDKYDFSWIVFNIKAFVVAEYNLVFTNSQ